MEKPEPSVRLVTRNVSPDFVLQLVPSFVPSEESSVSMISLSRVTAAVWTVVDIAFAGMTNLPAAADPQIAGLLLEAQFSKVPKADEISGWPPTLHTVPAGQAESTDAELAANSKTSLSEVVPFGIK